MEELMDWAVLFGKVWVVAQIIGYVLALALIIVVIIIILRIFKEMR